MKHETFSVMITWMLIILMTGCQTTSITPICKHIVLSQALAYTEKGYDVEILLGKNKYPSKYKYHVVTRIKDKKQKNWEYVDQPKIVFHTSPNPPKNIIWLRILSFDEVVQLSKNNDRK